jgi:murein L,D-transpeptidase YcbB/YkuD
MTGLAPQYPAYVQLQGALARYRQIAENGGWDQLPASIVRQRGRTRGLEALRRRLHVEGDLAHDNGSGRLDDELRAAISRFQWRNGLKADGELNTKTLQRLNVSVGERIASISLNLERLRVSLRDMPATRVEVNLPAATAFLYRDGFPFMSMNVVVGAPKHETPELSSVIDSIVLNPPWNIPRSIIMNEIKPHIRRDPKYLNKNRMYWMKDQLIQEPGPWNALGRVKFDFPNPYSVYLHDTPSRQLFTDPERAASHGCVRLERPVDLAVELLRGNADWSREAVQAAIENGRTQRIRLQDPMPVVLSYQTAFADADGTVHFRTDIYGRDTQMTLALANRVASTSSGAAP